MNGKSQKIGSLSEAQRFAYLQAMEVPVWVPRNIENLHGEASLDATDMSQEAASTDSTDSVNAQVSGEILNNSSELQSEPQSNQPQPVNSKSNDVDPSKTDNVPFARDDATESLSTTEVRSTALPESQTVAVENESQHSTKLFTHYLKMVPWSRGVQDDPAILIVCRHQTDQPAQSFARANAPSQFMSDYIQALNEFLNDKPGDFQIRLGHLAQAGLSQDCVELSQVIEKIQPKIILLLGDETVKELFENHHDVATLRGKVLKLSDGQICLASYHPYTLIKNPSLKRLAMADLQFCASLL